MSWFNRPNQIEDFAEAIRPELCESTVPMPDPDLIGRIRASRDSGARVILPDVDSSPVTIRRRFLVPALVAAALLVMIVPIRRSVQVDSSESDASSLSRIATEWLPGSIVLAQTAASTGAGKAQPMVFLRPGNLRPMRLEYLRTWRDSAKRETSRINGLMSVERIVRDGTPAFLVVSRNEGIRNGGRLFSLDSVTVARENLALLHHTALERPYSRYDEISIDQTFRRDSVVGRMRVMRNRKLDAQRPIARKLAASANPYIVDALAPVILGTTNLYPGWSGVASMLGWAVRDDDVFTPIHVHVDGEDMVSVPAGRFDCWRLSIRFTGGLFTYWVRKSDGIGIRGIEREKSGTIREVVLTKGSFSAQ